MNSINNTLFIGKVYNHYETLPSTNIFAAETLLKGPLREGTVFATFRQSDGRGQINNKWESEADKNIAFSVVLYPDFLPLEKHFLLNQAIALGVYDFVSLYVKKGVSIKWSNDIYVEDEKIAGILIQNTLQSNYFQHSIVGIGININQALFLSDAPNPTSIFLKTGYEISLFSAIDFLCKYLENRYLQLKSGQYDLLRQEYLDVLYRRDEWHWFRNQREEVFEGKIKNVSDLGLLNVETEADGVLDFNLKEIKFLHL